MSSIIFFNDKATFTKLNAVLQLKRRLISRAERYIFYSSSKHQQTHIHTKKNQIQYVHANNIWYCVNVFCGLFICISECSRCCLLFGLVYNFRDILQFRLLLERALKIYSWKTRRMKIMNDRWRNSLSLSLSFIHSFLLLHTMRLVVCDLYMYRIMCLL